MAAKKTTKKPGRARSQASAATDVALGNLLFGEGAQVIPAFEPPKKVTVPSSPRGGQTTISESVNSVTAQPVDSGIKGVTGGLAGTGASGTAAGGGSIGGNETLSTVLKSFLDQFNIGDAGLIADVTSAIADGRLNENSSTFIDDIGVVLADNSYIQTRFRGNVERRRQGLQPLPLSEILGLENGYITAMQAANLPPGFYDDPATDFQNLIARNVSVAEVSRRINQGYAAVRAADPEVTRQLKELYGVTDGALAAYFLDPARMETEITKQVESAQLAAQGRQLAGIQLSQQQAEQLQQAGVSTAAAREGFGAIAQQQDLFAAQMAGEQAVSTAEQVAGTFGTSPEAQQRIATRRRRRQAAFEEGGGFAQINQFSVGGLGTATT